MKHLLAILFFVGVAASASAQEQFYKVVKEYFRVNPFAGRFSAFVNAVKTDPELKITDDTEKTDTSLFNIQGDYKTFNPFAIRARRVEMLLGEKELVIRQRNQVLDTFVFYQITGFFDSTVQTAKAVQKEYKRICKKIKRDLPQGEEILLTQVKGIRNGALTNLTSRGSASPPISIGWYLKNDGELALLVALRMNYINNRAVPRGGYFSLRQYMNWFTLPAD
ncbi:hypothetical protein LL912_13790 [Niabella sp. CC-SYL272]|uniref:hypothetical protein n=1 Tax=Niabella agricola TaxID=2891571 RepID=UPI001F452926|nr:hypothetical protein [Niabella agricola]MCF3109847.1 hypothetical protein [Niabella agricola]